MIKSIRWRANKPKNIFAYFFHFFVLSFDKYRDLLYQQIKVESTNAFLFFFYFFSFLDVESVLKSSNKNKK